MPTISESFWSRVDKHGPDDCWEWTGYRQYGYGRFHVKRKALRAHRFSYEECNGPIPDGLVIDHMCRNRACVNPSHLRAVTLAVNTIENSISPTALLAQQTDCKRGHPLSGENLYRWNGARQCRKCRAELNRKIKRIKAAATGRAYYGRPYNAKGDAHPNSKVTEIQRSEIAQSQERTAVLAERFGLHQKHVQKIKAAYRRTLSTHHPEER